MNKEQVRGVSFPSHDRGQIVPTIIQRSWVLWLDAVLTFLQLIAGCLPEFQIFRDLNEYGCFFFFFRPYCSQLGDWHMED